MRKRILSLALIFVALPLAADTPLERLKNEIERVSRISGSVVGVSAIHLETGRRVSVRGKEPFPMASSYKVPIAVQLLDRVDRGEVRLDEMIAIQPSDLHPGSGTLTNLFNKPGVALSVRNLLELMLLISDNSATDLILKKAGGAEAVTAKMRSLGLNGIRVDRPTSQLIADWVGFELPPEDQMTPEAVNAAMRAVTEEQRRAARARSDRDPRDTAHPDDMADLLEKIHRKVLHKPESAELLLDILRRCQTGEARIKGMLPPGTEVAHKTGTIGGSTIDVGIVTLPGDAGHVALAAFVKQAERTGEPSERTIAHVARSVYDYFLYSSAEATPETATASRIVAALAPSKGEGAVLRFDPEYRVALRGAVRRALESRGVRVIAELPYSPRPQGDASERLRSLLSETDIFVWLPVREEVLQTSPAELKALADWTALGGSRRELHFHGSGGSVLADGMRTEHPAAYDQLYLDALDIDYAALRARQDRAIAELRRGEVRIVTAAGTNLRMRVGNRPFNRQDGDASASRMAAAQMRIDRHIELPAGVVRVAPLEESVNGRLVIPWMRIGGGEARGVRFEFRSGVILRIRAEAGEALVKEALAAAGPAAMRFREIGIGFHPKLAPQPGSDVLPYFGYGSGVVRVSLGDNEELGGAVRGGFVRWFFLTDATVSAGSKTIVSKGRLAD